MLMKTSESKLKFNHKIIKEKNREITELNFNYQTDRRFFIETEVQVIKNKK